MNGRIFDQVEINKLISMRKSGRGIREIAKTLMRHPATISKKLKKFGMTKKIKAKTGKYKASGYVLIKCPSHYKANMHGYVYEHILIWEQYHNRKLPKGWIIHHLNGIKSDNRSENLFATTKSKHHHLLDIYKKRIMELEIEINRLKQLNLFLAKEA